MTYDAPCYATWMIWDLGMTGMVSYDHGSKVTHCFYGVTGAGGRGVFAGKIPLFDDIISFVRSEALLLRSVSGCLSGLNKTAPARSADGVKIECRYGGVWSLSEAVDLSKPVCFVIAWILHISTERKVH